MKIKQKTFIERITKDVLEAYWYDYQYLLEKTNEINKMKGLLSNSVTRLNEIKEQNFSIDKLEVKMNRIMQRQANEEGLLIKLITKKQSTEKIIASIPEPHKVILYLRYMCFYSIDQIADKLKYSPIRIYQLQKEAVGKFCEIYIEKDYSKL